MFQNYTIVGRLTKENELRYVGVNADYAVLNNTIATSEKLKDKERTFFLPFVMFGKRAEALKKYTNKGDVILLQGKLIEEKWRDNATGQEKSRIKLEVSDFTFLPQNSKNNSPRAQKEADEDYFNSPSNPF